MFVDFQVVVQLIHRPMRTKISFTTIGKLPNIRIWPIPAKKAGLETASIPATLSAYTAYLVQFLVGTIREALYGTGPLTSRQEEFREKDREGYPPLFSAFENFYIRDGFFKHSSFVSHHVSAK